jgi:hypothetical protein
MTSASYGTEGRSFIKAASKWRFEILEEESLRLRMVVFFDSEAKGFHLYLD